MSLLEALGNIVPVGCNMPRYQIGNTVYWLSDGALQMDQCASQLQILSATLETSPPSDPDVQAKTSLIIELASLFKGDKLRLHFHGQQDTVKIDLLSKDEERDPVNLRLCGQTDTVKIDLLGEDEQMDSVDLHLQLPGITGSLAAFEQLNGHFASEKYDVGSMWHVR